MRAVSRVGRFYPGVDVLSLRPTALMMMDKMIPITRAEEQLRDEWNTLTAEGVRRLATIVYGEETTLAETLAAQRTIQLSATQGD